VQADKHHRRVLLISNQVMHYRVAVYNYFHRRFAECGCDFQVIADRLQKQNRIPPAFRLQEIPFSFRAYRRAINEVRPDAVILFLLLKDLIMWPLAHWLKFKGIPFAIWTKGGNWDRKGSRLRYQAFNYLHSLSGGLILYAKECAEFVKPGLRSKCFVANNTLNFESFPEVRESNDEIKREFGIPFRKVVLFVGRMGVDGGRKRVDMLVDIFRTLDRTDIGLVLVGAGMPDEIRARLNSKNTMYLGEVHDAKDLGVAKLFKMADVCAIPGHVGLTVNQAFYWGLPVVAAEGHHPPEAAYLKSGHNGFMVPENDATAFKGKLLLLLDRDDLRAEFSRCARETILGEASIEQMFSGFYNCVEFMTGERKNNIASSPRTLPAASAAGTVLKN
jgi:glycosyltransferase involved in cell wall biosynthesis